MLQSNSCKHGRCKTSFEAEQRVAAWLVATGIVSLNNLKQMEDAFEDYSDAACAEAVDVVYELQVGMIAFLTKKYNVTPDMIAEEIGLYIDRYKTVGGDDNAAAVSASIAEMLHEVNGDVLKAMKCIDSMLQTSVSDSKENDVVMDFKLVGIHHV